MYTDSLGQRWYKIGLHIHTTLSDGTKSPEEAAMIYKNAGFDAIAITDHWQYHQTDEIAGLKIISGCEYNIGGTDSSHCVMHIVGVGMTEAPSLSQQSAAQKIIDSINQAGGLAILAHPAWSLNNVQDVQHLSGFGATEIYNTVSDVNQSSRPYSGYFVDILANAGIVYPLLATDDVHYYDGNDETKSYIMVKASDLSDAAILQAVRDGAFYATQGPELYVSREGEKIILRCTPCVKIMFLSNAVWAPDKILRGENLTYAEYPLKDFEKWVRVEVVDHEGRYGWSNIILR